MDNFFQQWRTYRTVISQDYMGHQDIAACLIQALSPVPERLKILDLGCGDAEVFFRLISEIPISDYEGVDSSAAALEFLYKRFQECVVPFQLHRTDMMSFLSQCQQRFDIILVGYCLHHLSSEEKQAFLQMAYRCLREEGVLFIYDVFFQAGESREQYLANYQNYINSNWTAISGQELDAVNTHFTDYDFPEEIETYRLWSHKAGFRQVTKLWEGDWHSHKLLRLSRANQNKDI